MEFSRKSETHSVLPTVNHRFDNLQWTLKSHGQRMKWVVLTGNDWLRHLGHVPSVLFLEMLKGFFVVFFIFRCVLPSCDSRSKVRLALPPSAVSLSCFFVYINTGWAVRNYMFEMMTSPPSPPTLSSACGTAVLGCHYEPYCVAAGWRQCQKRTSSWVKGWAHRRVTAKRQSVSLKLIYPAQRSLCFISEHLSYLHFIREGKYGIWEEEMRNSVNKCCCWQEICPLFFCLCPYLYICTCSVLSPYIYLHGDVFWHPYILSFGLCPHCILYVFISVLHFCKISYI